MSDLRDAARQALEALEEATNYTGCEAWSPSMTDECLAVAVTLRAALEQPEQAEPVAWLESPYGSIRMNTTMRFQFPPQSLKWKIPLYTHPPRRGWRGLTEEKIKALSNDCYDGGHTNPMILFARAVEAALRSKNHE